MTTSEMTTIETIVSRAASDPDFLKRLAQDPFGTIAAEGYQIPAAEVKALLEMPEASDEEVAEALQQRISHSGGSYQVGALVFGGGAS